MLACRFFERSADNGENHQFEDSTRGSNSLTAFFLHDSILSTLFTSNPQHAFAATRKISMLSGLDQV